MNVVHYLFITDLQLDQTKLENKIIFGWFNHFDRIIHAHNNKNLNILTVAKIYAYELNVLVLVCSV